MADISGYLNNIRSAESGETVRDSIIQCLNKINNDNPNKTKPLNVTANGTYTSETGYSYNPVTVNVPAGGSSNYTFEELEVTENGEYEPEEDNTMYKKVTVNVPQLANDLAPDGYEITQNGEYDPLLDGYDGYGKIIVNVNEATGEGPFTVEFYDKDISDPTAKVVQTQTVNKNGNASYQGPTPVSPTGQVFAGWSPDPINVTRDLKCYPRFIDKQIVIGEILDDWATICANRGGDRYPLGSYKTMPFSYTWKLADMLEVMPNWVHHPSIEQYPNCEMTLSANFIMYKVAVGESGSVSTWLSRPTSTLLSSSQGGGGRPEWYLNANPYGGYPGYSGSVVDKFLEHIFYQAMADCFKTSIKSVNKYHQNLDPARTSPPYNMDVINRHIWIPSIKEIFTTGEISGSVNETNLFMPVDNDTSGNYELNKTIFVDNVMSGISYFRDQLGLSKDEFMDAMIATGLPFSLRDSYTHDTGYTGWFYPVCPSDGRAIRDTNSQRGYHYAGNLMIGFCMG